MPVTIYALSLTAPDGESLVDRLYHTAPAVRRSVADSYRREEDRCRFLASRALLSLALRDKTEKKGLEEAALRRTPAGKPYLVDAPHIDFSLAHSGSWVLCALSLAEGGSRTEEVRAAHPVGCDVEAFPAGRSPERLDSLARRILPPDEYRLWQSDDDHKGRCRRFAHAWAIRESAVKALGCGLTVPLRSLHTDTENGLITAADDRIPLPEGYCLRFCEKTLPGGYAAACSLLMPAVVGSPHDAPHFSFRFIDPAVHF